MADEFYKLLGDNYAYVATVAKNKAGLKGGVDYSTRPYCILAGDSEEARQHAVVLAKNAEVCVFGAESLNYAIERATLNPSGLSFELSERWLKRGWINILSPRLIRWWLAYQRHYRKANFYKLNASAFAAEDHLKLHTYKGRMFKWGYFTKVDEEFDVEASIVDASTSEIIPLMWCSRFLTWKHPELPVMMAKKLKDKGYKFMLSMYGDEGNAAKHDGIYPRKKLEYLITKLDVGDCVQLMGNRPNNEIIQAMRKSAIFIFTSDSHEGWGAVANESLSCGCVLVGSDAIGSVPYLVQDGFNGFHFENCKVASLTEKVEWLLSHQNEMKQMQRNAYERMRDVWGPAHAARAFLKLVNDMLNNKTCSLMSGPVSIA